MREDRPESWRSSVCRWEDRGVVARTFRISVNGGVGGAFPWWGSACLYSAVRHLRYEAPTVAIIEAF